MWWKIIIFLGMIAAIIASFMMPAPQQMLGEYSRIVYYHVPMAWVSVLAFLMAMVYSIRYLRKKKLVEDQKASSAATLGLVFCILATISGSIFARAAWGSFWNWDPRETSILILLLIYAAYFALRGAIEVPEKKAALSAVYAVFAFVTVPFLVFVVPRVTPSLHPSDSVINEQLKFTMSLEVRLVFYAFLALFTVIYFWIFSLTSRIKIIETKITEETD